MDLQTQHTTDLDSPSAALDLWPTFLSLPSSTNPESFVLFTRYEQDTNGDGQLDADDESSIWMQSQPGEPADHSRVFQLTPGHQFHAYPTTTESFLYYADLKKGDVFRIDIPAFLTDYDHFNEAKALAASYQDTGRPDQALLVLTNISRNLLGKLSPEAQADFDFSLAEAYAQEHNFVAARRAITRHQTQGGQIGALASIFNMTLRVQERARVASTAERDRLITTAIKELLDLGHQHQAQEEVYGNAYIAAGRLHLFAYHPLKALDFLIKVENLQNKEIRAKALFSRAEAYQALGDTTNVQKVFIDVIHLFGEDSSWGRRAIHRALDLAQQGQTPQDAIAALNQFTAQHADLPILSATGRLRVATFYDELGEQRSALESLESVLASPDIPRALTIQAYQHKAALLSRAERFQEAAETYSALGQFTGNGAAQLQDTQELLVLQLVKKALKDRTIGETRIAAKSLKHLITQYPHSVEAHRAYIETKAMLKDTQAIQRWYADLAQTHTQNAVYRYGQALAYSYSNPPDLPLVLETLTEAVQLDPSISYIHQTLGWAYEQTERITGESGNLEEAEREYRIALDLNDSARLPEVESQLLLNLGNTYLALGNFREAYRHYRQRDDQFTPIGDSTTEMLYRKSYGEACFKSGRSQEAVTQYQLALRRAPSDQPVFKAQLLERLALAHQDLG